MPTVFQSRDDRRPNGVAAVGRGGSYRRRTSKHFATQIPLAGLRQHHGKSRHNVGRRRKRQRPFQSQQRRATPSKIMKSYVIVIAL
jgi:hypothetical protein